MANAARGDLKGAFGTATAVPALPVATPSVLPLNETQANRFLRENQKPVFCLVSQQKHVLKMLSISPAPKP